MPTGQKVSALIVVALAALGALYTVLSGNEPLLGLDLQGGVSVVLEPTGTTDDGEGQSREVTEESLDLTVELLRSRIDEIGVAEPEISRQGNNIVVGLPGLVQEQEQALDRLRQTAELRFRPVLLQLGPGELDLGPEDGEIAPSIDADAETSDSTVVDADAETSDSTVVDADVETSDSTVVDADVETSDSTVVDADAETSDSTDVVDDEQSLGSYGGRTSPVALIAYVADGETAEATDTTVAVDAAEITEITETTVAAAEVTEVTETTLAPEVNEPTGSTLAGAGEALREDADLGIPGFPVECLEPGLTPDAEDRIDETVILPDSDGNRFCLGPATLDDQLLTGDMVETANVGLQTGRGWQVSPTLNAGPDGIDRFNAIASVCFLGTPEICPTGQLAVVLDHQVISAPSIRSESFGREDIVISGNEQEPFTEEEARRLAEALRFGSLPLELVAQETRTVSASIGQDVLRSGVIAGLIGLVLVALYLLAYYRLAGLVAISGLLLSAALLWTIVAWFGETFGLALSLAGVVGLIVSIGVSTDSNIVYFENVKDSYRSGRRVPTAIERAYESSISTIVKADIVSLIAAVLLYTLTVGAVRGFAFYLGLATILDLIISWMFMRPALAWLARRSAVEKNPRLLGLPATGGHDS